MSELLNYNDIIIEALEVFTHHILYVRELYPPMIFRKRKMYNCPVYVSIYPPINSYIAQVLTTAKELKKNKQLYKVEIVIYRDDDCICEKYVFDTADNVSPNGSGEDGYLLEFEQKLRTSLFKLSQRTKAFKKLPRDARFKIQLHTTQTEFVKSCCGPGNEEFPWLYISPTDDNKYKQVQILPLGVIDNTSIAINVEVCL